MRRYSDRYEAGEDLARILKSRGEDFRDAIVLALPRGGLPVAYPVALALGAPLDVFIVRKLGVPGHEELAMGAIASGGVRVVNRDVVDQLGIPQRAIEAVAQREIIELQRRERDYRGNRPPLDVKGKKVIVIDDGLATGSTMRAAAAALRQEGASKVIVAVPVAARETCDDFREEVDEIICAMTPEPFRAVGLWYENFDQTTDDEVRDLLQRAEARTPNTQHSALSTQH
ncbi:MAG TPA: phosphoribosyltransferase [Thermoanaerobaculia bacterium]|jgi:predicted phosphoribosyltransferase|nr:phosphoribosyltransferase [Thermoanaerobaculia bacterium]